MRDAFERFLDRHTIGTYFGGAGCGCGWDGIHSSEHLAEVIAREFLVVPRSEIAEPLGYAVLAKRPDGRDPGRYRFAEAGHIWTDRDPVEEHLLDCQDRAQMDPKLYRGVKYIIAELREAGDAP